MTEPGGRFNIPPTAAVPALDVDQWQEWRDTGSVSMAGGLGRLLSSKPGDRMFGVRPRIYFLTHPIDTPAEYRAAIAVLLDALAQVGEPLFTDGDATDLRLCATDYDSPGVRSAGGNWPTYAPRALESLAARIASLLPPVDPQEGSAP